ncbi:DUF1643 domain-containing protein [Pseudomonas sp.]|uniref:DUF1643 domain-containing protein n=1 Tax=Pseudomonas sp. TaxID=306 RepID=UPI002629F19D|nr:DUF1643 domain-containing protein [Pseudomonas sp.]
MTGSALIDGPYRYLLSREWAAGPRICFIMLNPSTADASEDDPTIRRCIGFATALGAGAIDVVNLFALRATDPAELRKHAAPEGPENIVHIARAASGAEMVICAWGAHAFAKPRARVVLGVLASMSITPHCLRQTKDGHPAHPLYLPSSLRPAPLETRHDDR